MTIYYEAMPHNEKLRLEFAARLHNALDLAGVRKRGRPTDVAHEISTRVELVSRKATAKWLSGDTIPHPLHMRALAEWLQVRIEWLQFGTEPMQRGAKTESSRNIVGSKAARLTARIADLERRGLLNKDVLRLLNAALDVASTSEKPQS